MQKNILTIFPYYLLLMAIAPTVSLLATNYRQINPQNIIRPVILSMVLALGTYYFLLRVMREKNKAGIFGTAFIFVVLNYGRAHIYLQEHTNMITEVGNLIHLFLGFFALGILLVVFRALERFPRIDTLPIYAICLTLIILPSYNIAEIIFQQQRTFSPKKVEINISESHPPLPDIYHIVVDAYSREDYLASIGYDNTEFLNFLRSQGFYIADCSKSNYPRTALSLASMLNLEYLWQIFPDKDQWARDDAAVYGALSNNLVHNVLRQQGYQFVTTVNGYYWSEHTKFADVIVAPESKGILTPYLLPIERKFIENSAFRVLLDFGDLKELKNGYLLHGEHYEQVMVALDSLKAIPQISEPTYSYFHLTVPHDPYIFSPDGEIAPEIEGHEGYLRNIKFINNQLMPIISEIIQTSDIPPVILLHGDHGYASKSTDKYLILFALFLPNNSSTLYQTLSPINAYRVIFNEVFNMNFTLLSDKSIQADIGGPFRRTEVQFSLEDSICPKTN